MSSAFSLMLKHSRSKNSRKTIVVMMDSPSKRSTLSPKRDPLPEPVDINAYSNNMEATQYQVVGGATTNKTYLVPSLSSESEHGETTHLRTRSSRNMSCSKCRFDLALAFALTIVASIAATAYLTYYFLKVHYEGCLTAEMLPTLRQTQALRSPRDCKEHFDNGALVDGQYRIYPEKTSSVYVYCDMTNGGWTVLQRRTNGKENFDRGWNDYVNGFGNLSSDHWMGLKHQHLLTEYDTQYQIVFEFLMDDTGEWATALYQSYHVDNDETNYTMRISPVAEYNKEMVKYIDDRKGFYYHHNLQFSTKDVDNDQRVSQNCAQVMNCGGFWYKNCLVFCINGRYDRMFLFEAAHLQKFISQSIVKIIPYD